MSRTQSKPKIKTIPWDSAAYLKSDKDIAHYLEAVFEDGDRQQHLTPCVSGCAGAQLVLDL